VRKHGQTPRQPPGLPLTQGASGRFGRMFELDPCPLYSNEQLNELAESMREPENAPAEALDSPKIPAGYTYFGQFVDHDITFDATSRLRVDSDLDALRDFRTPRLDLDSLYGSGPVDEPFLYDQNQQGWLLVSRNKFDELDLPRSGRDVALIGDPRNDENVLICGLTITMLRLHNRTYGDLGKNTRFAAPGSDDGRFDDARRRACWHYQWVIVHDYLPRICGEEVVAKLLTKDKKTGKPRVALEHYKPKQDGAYMPIEFSAAAFRFGHSQVRPSYVLNDRIGSLPLFAPGDTRQIGRDLRGQQALLPGWTVDWPGLLPIDDKVKPQPSRLIDARLTSALFDLPGIPAGQPQSLPLRTLLRGQDFKLPSGQDVARALRVTPLSAEELGVELSPTPLWFYILKESELVSGGLQLGPTGAHIVAEVLLGLLKADTYSYLNANPAWKPGQKGSSGFDGTFGLSDLVSFATGIHD
jgi:Animal haem peroxidase